MKQEGLEGLLRAYNNIELKSIETGKTSLEEILCISEERKIYEAKEGNKINMLSADLFMDSAEKVSFVKHPRFIEIEKHRHDFLEMSYAFSGEFTQIINDQVVTLKEGDFILLDTDVVHKIMKVDEGTLIINILLRKDYFNQGILVRLAENDVISEFVIDAIRKNSVRNGRFLHFPSHGNKKVRHYISAAMCEYVDSDIASNEVINCNLILLFTELLRVSRNNPISLKPKISSYTSIIDILQYIEEHYQTTNLIKVAEHFHFHPNYLSRLLKEKSGKTFTQLIQEFRLRQARLLLEHTEIQVRSIAEEIGYSNFNHFYQKFKEYSLITPAEYRKQFRK
jgi:AraC-like DNA-binding protein/mannose-6-phosphate isomerase-like protein (cupin superfamily)